MKGKTPNEMREYLYEKYNENPGWPFDGQWTLKNAVDFYSKLQSLDDNAVKILYNKATTMYAQ